MTLVLSCLAPDYVIQVSDQRITQISDGALIDDLRNKGTMFCAQMGFAYSGLAEIDGTPSDRWLAEVLARELTLEAGLASVVSRASNLFQSIALPLRLKRHAFVGVGFCRPSPESALRACQITVSNFLSDGGEWLSDAQPSFDVEVVLRREDRPFTLCRPVGVRVPEEILKNLKKYIRSCLSHGTAPLEVVRVMAGAIRSVAEFEATVGKSLLVIFIPRHAVESQTIMFTTPVAPGGLDRWDSPMFLHIPADSPDPYWEFPNFVCNGMLALGALEQEGTFPGPEFLHPDAQLNLVTYAHFLSSSIVVEHWVEFVHSLGVRVDSLGMLSRDLKMLQHAGVRTPNRIEQLLKQSEPWGRELLLEYYSTWFPEVIKEGKLSFVRSGIVTHLLVANNIDLFPAEVLIRDYSWGLAERFLTIVGRHRPHKSK